MYEALEVKNLGQNLSFMTIKLPGNHFFFLISLTISFCIFEMSMVRKGGFSSGIDGKESACNARAEFNPWVEKIP